MDKVVFEHKPTINESKLLYAQSEIIDWINAQRGCAVCNTMLRDAKPSIEQELETGLTATGDIVGKFCSCCGRGICTRIFLPAAKYEELRQEFWSKTAGRADIGDGSKFHDIPVFSYSGDEIIYCTD